MLVSACVCVCGRSNLLLVSACVGCVWEVYPAAS